MQLAAIVQAGGGPLLQLQEELARQQTPIQPPGYITPEESENPNINHLLDNLILKEN